MLLQKITISQETTNSGPCTEQLTMYAAKHQKQAPEFCYICPIELFTSSEYMWWRIYCHEFCYILLHIDHSMVL